MPHALGRILLPVTSSANSIPTETSVLTDDPLKCGEADLVVLVQGMDKPASLFKGAKLDDVLAEV